MATRGSPGPGWLPEAQGIAALGAAGPVRSWLVSVIAAPVAVHLCWQGGKCASMAWSKLAELPREIEYTKAPFLGARLLESIPL